jgi:hypothetical protein
MEDGQSADACAKAVLVGDIRFLAPDLKCQRAPAARSVGLREL